MGQTPAMVDGRTRRKARGGARRGTGRRLGSGRYGEPTASVRILLSVPLSVQSLLKNGTRKLPLVAAGKPSEASMIGA